MPLDDPRAPFSTRDTELHVDDALSAGALRTPRPPSRPTRNRCWRRCSPPRGCCRTPFTGFAAALQRLDRRRDSLLHAVHELDRVGAGAQRGEALLDHACRRARSRSWCRRRPTSLVWRDTSRATCAPMFSNGSGAARPRRRSLTPSRETIGRALRPVDDAVEPAGPRASRSTARASLATPRPERFARRFVVQHHLGHGDSSEFAIFVAIIVGGIGGVRSASIGLVVWSVIVVSIGSPFAPVSFPG